MLDTVRAFALERAAALGQLPNAAERHAQYFAELAEAAEPEFLGPGQAIWLERLAAEYDNLRGAMTWCRTQAPVVGLRMAASLERYYEWRGNWREGAAWLTALLDQARQAPAALRAKALLTSGIHAYRSGQHPAATAALTKSLRLFEMLGDQPGEVARVHNNLGNVYYDQERLDQAVAEYRLALHIRQSEGDHGGVASTLNNLALSYQLRGDWALAELLLEESSEPVP